MILTIVRIAQEQAKIQPHFTRKTAPFGLDDFKFFVPLAGLRTSLNLAANFFNFSNYPSLTVNSMTSHPSILSLIASNRSW